MVKGVAWVRLRRVCYVGGERRARVVHAAGASESEWEPRDPAAFQAHVARVGGAQAGQSARRFWPR